MKKVSKAEGTLVRAKSYSKIVQPSEKLPAKLRAELNKLSQCGKADTGLSDIPVTKKSDWKDAKRGLFYRPIKQQITLRIDADVIQWLKDQGSGYQSRLNGILRAEMLKAG